MEQNSETYSEGQSHLCILRSDMALSELFRVLYKRERVGTQEHATVGREEIDRKFSHVCIVLLPTEGGIKWEERDMQTPEWDRRKVQLNRAASRSWSSSDLAKENKAARQECGVGEVCTVHITQGEV